MPTNEAEVAELLKVREQVARVVVSLLKSRRQDADINQAQIGYALGVSEDVVSNMEVLKKPIPIEDAIAWALITGKDPSGVELTKFLEDLQHSLGRIFPRKP